MQEDKLVIYKLKCISVISLTFMTVEILGGIMANSIAILSDAFHLLSDVIAYMISLQAVLMSHRKAPSYMTFGYEKLQPLGALVNVAIIWFVTFELLIEATQRIINKEIVQQPLYMLLTSFFGLGCNLYIMRVLHSDPHVDHCHGHDHDHDHGHDHHHHGHKHDHHAHDHNHKSHKHDHTHSHDHSHDHNHHSHSHQDHDHNSHPDCNSQNHIHSQEPHSHSHPHPEVASTQHLQQTTPQPVPQSEAFCALDHDHNEDRANCNNQGYFKITKDSLNEQIGNKTINESEELVQDKQSKRRAIFDNINIQAAHIHIISDIILSIGVIVSALIIYFCTVPDEGWTYWQLADPFCTYLFSVMAIYSTIGIIKDSTLILLDGCDDKNLYQEIVDQLEKVEQIESFTDLRVWSLNRNKFSGAVKVYLKPEIENDSRLRNSIRQKVSKIFTDRQVTYYLEILPSYNQPQQLKNESE